MTKIAADPPICIVCGCTDDHACPGGCWWSWVNGNAGIRAAQNDARSINRRLAARCSLLAAFLLLALGVACHGCQGKSEPLTPCERDLLEHYLRCDGHAAWFLAEDQRMYAVCAERDWDARMIEKTEDQIKLEGIRPFIADGRAEAMTDSPCQCLDPACIDEAYPDCDGVPLAAQACSIHDPAIGGHDDPRTPAISGAMEDK